MRQAGCVSSSVTPDGVSAHARFDVGSIDLLSTLSVPSSLRGDPTTRLSSREFARATHTPDGPASVRVRWSLDPDVGVVDVEAWGAGAAWLVARADRMLGLHDDISGFDPQLPALRDAWRRRFRARMSASATLWHDVAAIILQQRVTTADAAEQWAALVRGLGEPAPGPVDLMCPPTPEVIGSLEYYALHPFGIERQRAEILGRVARRARRLGALVDGPFEEAEPVLRSVRGIGPWTAGFLQALTWGDPDAVIPGDFGMPSMISWVLASEPRGDDDRMIELLEPWRPHRYRVVQLAWASGISPPRRHHRYRRNRIARY